MFTNNIPFNDALKCYEDLVNSKPEDDPTLTILGSEFSIYALKKADQGDSAAKRWLSSQPNAPQPEQSDKIQDVLFLLELEDDELKKKPEISEKPKIFQKKNSLQNKKNESDSSDHKIEIETDAETENNLSAPEKPAIFNEKNDNPLYKLARLSPKKIKAALEPFEKLSGIDNIKAQVLEFIEMEHVQQKRSLANLKRVNDEARHMIFTGNPGTGKTTVARIIAKIFKELGLLTKDDVLEVDRSDLVGPYIGQTEERTRDILEQAKGGILFIDEAYALDPGFQWDFGQEAIATILKFMEDNRHDLIVIAAGYPNEMKHFMRMNPGLDSRFATKVHFEDMNTETLFKIFEDMVLENDYVLEELAKNAIKGEILRLKKFAPADFANARTVRNLFEKTLRHQAKRITAERLKSKKALRLIKMEDISTEDIVTKGNVSYFPKGKKT